MLAIGRALMQDPKLIMFDEPSLGLAPILVQEVFNVVKKLHQQGLTMPECQELNWSPFTQSKKRKKASILQTTKAGRKLFLTGTPVFDTNGRLVRVVVNERDITDISRLHRELEEKALLNSGQGYYFSG